MNSSMHFQGADVGDNLYVLSMILLLKLYAFGAKMSGAKESHMNPKPMWHVSYFCTRLGI